MVVLVSIPRRKYRMLRSHLFQDDKEQGCFLFADTRLIGAVVHLQVKGLHFIKPDKWDHQSDYHLELSEKEKVRIMLRARKNNQDLIECHSHCCEGPARFSASDRYGLDEFIQYVWWKLPGAIYGALVLTKNDIVGQAWMPKNRTPLTIREIRITSE